MLSPASPGSSGRHSRYASPHKAHSPFISNPRAQPSLPGTPIPRRSVANSESPGRSMDIDHNRFSGEKGKHAEEARTFALSDTLSVRLAATHPMEMQQAFQAADPTRDMFMGSVHVLGPQSSYAVVTSTQTCFVWKIDINCPFHPPTCYMFPVPPSNPAKPYLTVPFASLLPFGASREPGLIIVSSSGEVRFWDSIGTGIAGAERFSTTRISLDENEYVDGIERVDASVYIVRTKTSLHRLAVTARPGTGKFTVLATPFNDPQQYQDSSWLNPLRILQRRNVGWEGEVVAVVSPSSRGCAHGRSKELNFRGGEERTIWVLTSKNLMKWSVNLEGGERCEVNHDVREIVTRAIVDKVGGDKLTLDVELLDVTLDNQGRPMLLISHSPHGGNDASPLGLDTTPTRVYAIVRLQLSTRFEGLMINGDIEVLPYELAADPRRASPPRLSFLEHSICDDGKNDALNLAFSQFSDAFAFTCCAPPYQEQLHLKSADDMILGFSVLEHANVQEILLLTTEMVLAARPNFDNIAKMRDDVHVGRASVLKSTILQAMKYGIKPGNPLRFQLPSIADGESLKVAAEHMSHLFLTSDLDVVPQNLSMGAQLFSRQSALQALVTFIGESGGLSKLSQSTREHLLADAEKLAAACGLWDSHNEQTRRTASLRLLPTAIEAYMSSIDCSYEGDAVRSFFNFQVQHIGDLVPEIAHVTKSSLSSSETSEAKIHLLLQANGLVLALLTQAFRYRSDNRPKYQISGAITHPWTSEPNLLMILRQLFDLTVQLRTKEIDKITSREEPFGEASVQDELTLQLRELSSCLFRTYKDRLDFLDGRSLEGGGSERERNRVSEEFRTMRPEVLDHLVRIDSTDYAFQLAETYRDFHALSQLSYHPFATKVIPATKRIRDYIQRFGQEFTSELYSWYIEQGKLGLMFQQEPEFADDIESFFSRSPAPRISWLLDVGKQEYQRAASALLGEAEKETNRETKHLMLSIGKLASMAKGPAATPQDKITAFNNSLDFMAIHDMLLDQFNEGFGNPADFAVESRVLAITSAKCSIPTDRAALLNLFQHILRQLLHGNVLTEEDAIDLLSIKDNSGRPNDFVDALIIISDSLHMTESRKCTALQNVWRRIYLHDNWEQIRDTANKNDYELTARLRGTQLYKTLVSPSLPRNGVLPPSEAIQVPSQEQIETRWPGMAPNQIFELCQDFAKEGSILAESGPSDAEFSHVRKLAEDDIRCKI